MHRDISVGNLYLYNGRGIIGDLEYSNRKGSSAVHEVRSVSFPFHSWSLNTAERSYSCDKCSLDFMSSEAIKCQFLFPADISRDRLRDLLKSKATVSTATPRPSRTGGFFHYDLHDLESLWWVAIWILIFNRDGKVASDHGGQHDSWRRFALKLFPRTHATENRQDFFLGRNIQEEAVALMPESFHGIFKLLCVLAGSLVGRYEAFERGFPRRMWETLEGIQEDFFEVFDFIVPQATGVKLHPWAAPAGLGEANEKNTSSEERKEGGALVDTDRLSERETGDPIPEGSDEGDENEVENLIGGVSVSCIQICPDEKDEDEVEDMLLDEFKNLDINDSADEEDNVEHGTE